jgi:cysteinyl-tRNA synthetase
MSTCCLGNHFDIHGGGLDLQFPHHENEIAQSEGATGEKFVNLWMHNGFVRVNEEKMSKSLGNFFTIREVLKLFDPEVVRYFILASHYRSPLNYSDESLEQAKSALTRLYTALKDLPDAAAPANSVYETRFNAAMDDDFNTALAVSVLFELATDINKARVGDITQAAALGALLRKLAGILGIVQRQPEDYLKAGAPADGLSNEAIEQLIQQRLAARAAKNWAESDRIRDELKAQGVILEDGKGATTWRRT